MKISVLFSVFASSLALSTFPVFFDSSNHLHRDLNYHPEQPARITSCIKALNEMKKSFQNIELIDVADTAEAMEKVRVEYKPFSQAELDHAREVLLKTHDKQLIFGLEKICNDSKKKRIEDGKDPLGHLGYVDPDTYVTTFTFDVCLRTTAAWIRAVDVAMSSKRPAMSLTRPPGHHAMYAKSNGFCTFNFAAAAALHVLQQDRNKRVSIIDWDVHYGQGVSDIIKKYENARYVSIHQIPAFPYVGEKLQVEGEYKNIYTIPMPAETSWLCGYSERFEKALQFACKAGEWEPDIVIVSAGYDALDSDELASCCLNANDYGTMSSRLSEYLESETGDKVAIMLGLEGGYQLSDMAGGGNLPDAVVASIRALIESEVPSSNTR